MGVWVGDANLRAPQAASLETRNVSEKNLTKWASKATRDKEIIQNR